MHAVDVEPVKMHYIHDMCGSHGYSVSVVRKLYSGGLTQSIYCDLLTDGDRAEIAARLGEQFTVAVRL